MVKASLGFTARWESRLIFLVSLSETNKQNQTRRAREKAQGLRAPLAFAEDLGWAPQNTHGNSRLSLITVPGDRFFSDFLGHQVSTMWVHRHTCKAKHSHTEKENKCKNIFKNKI